MYTYEVRPRADRRGFNLISDVLPFGALWHTKADHAIDYAKFFSAGKEPGQSSLLTQRVKILARLTNHLSSLNATVASGGK